MEVDSGFRRLPGSVFSEWFEGRLLSNTPPGQTELYDQQQSKNYGRANRGSVQEVKKRRSYTHEAIVQLRGKDGDITMVLVISCAHDWRVNVPIGGKLTGVRSQ